MRLFISAVEQNGFEKSKCKAFEALLLIHVKCYILE